MNRGHAAGMPGLPGLQQCQRFGAAHLADDDAVGPQPHGRAHQPRQISGFAGMQLHQISARHWISQVSSMIT